MPLMPSIGSPSDHGPAGSVAVNSTHPRGPAIVTIT